MARIRAGTWVGDDASGAGVFISSMKEKVRPGEDRGGVWLRVQGLGSREGPHRKRPFIFLQVK